MASKMGSNAGASMKPTKLTVRLLEKLAPKGRVHDTDVPGLFAEAGKTGKVKLRFKTTLREGPKGGSREKQTVKETLGAWPEMSLEAARQKATALRLMIRAGIDPRKKDVVAPTDAPWTVDRLIAEYIGDRRRVGKADRTLADIEKRCSEYLDTEIRYEVELRKDLKQARKQAAWGPLPLTTITDQLARERHIAITTNHGSVVANDTLRNFRACWNWARKTQKHLGLGENPVNAITFNLQRQRTETLTLPDLKDWGKRLATVRNPLRREMHLIGLLTGLRPGTLVGLERAWIRFDVGAVVIPASAMKKRKEFHLPLSGHLVEIFRRALQISELMYPKAPFLFATRAKKDRSGPVVATVSWQEKTELPNETGYVLRHMYSNAASAAYVQKPERMMLMGQRVAGLEGTYLNDRYLFDKLKAEQEKVTAYLLKELG